MRAVVGWCLRLLGAGRCYCRCLELLEVLEAAGEAVGFWGCLSSCWVLLGILKYPEGTGAARCCHGFLGVSGSCWEQKNHREARRHWKVRLCTTQALLNRVPDLSEVTQLQSRAL